MKSRAPSTTPEPMAWAEIVRAATTPLTASPPPIVGVDTERREPVHLPIIEDDKEHLLCLETSSLRR